MGRKFGQAGLDFLMTYGWALLIIVLLVGVLYALGLFNTSSFAGNRSAGFAAFSVEGWNVASNGPFTIQLRNRAGYTVNVTGIDYEFDNMQSPVAGVAVSNDLKNDVSTGMLTVANTIGGYNPNDQYSVKLSIFYVDTKTGFNYTDTGNLIGKAT